MHRAAGIESGSIRNQLIDKLEQQGAEVSHCLILHRSSALVLAWCCPSVQRGARSVQLLLKNLADTLEVNIHEVRASGIWQVMCDARLRLQKHLPVDL